MNTPNSTPLIVRARALLLFCAVAVFASPTAFASQALDNFWLAPSSEAADKKSTAAGVSVESNWVEKPADHYQRQSDTDRVSSTFLSKDAGTYGLTFASNYSETGFSNQEYGIAMGARFGALSLYGNSGSGDSYSRNTNSYHGLDPYAFHGGNNVDYRYNGVALGYALENSDILFGQTTVRARGLEDRKASYVDFSNNRFFARFTHIERGNDSVGRGLDLGINVGKFNLGFQQIENRYDVSNKRIRLNWNKSKSNKFWFDFSKHDNSRLVENTDTQAMMTWQHTFGANKFISAIAGGQKKQKRNSARRGILIGGAAAAGAILATSGNSSQDSAVRVAPKTQTQTLADDSTSSLTTSISAQHEAARKKLNEVNPLSTAANKEYGGYVYQAADGSYAATEAVIGDNSSVGLPDIVSGVPVGTTTRASYHTHAAFDPAFDSENFSEADLEGDRGDNIDGYLATPSGAFKYHEVLTGNISKLGTVSK